MTPLEWFFAGGIWMWPILLLVLIGLTLLVVVLLRMGSAQPPRGIGIALLVVGVLCLAAGGAGHVHSKARLNAFVEQLDAVKPELLEIGNRETRVPLEASIVPGIVFLAVGLFAARRRG